MLELIERKAAGETEIVEAPAAVDRADKVVDLMAALEASVAAAKEARKRHPTGRAPTRRRADEQPAKSGAEEAQVRRDEHGGAKNARRPPKSARCR